MSLINDALKRASNSRPVLIDVEAVPMMQPVPETNRGTGPVPIVLFIVGIGALLISGAFWLKAKGTPAQTAAVTEPVTPPLKIATPAPAPALPAVQQTDTEVAAPVTTTTSASVPESPAPRPVVTVPVAEQPATEPSAAEIAPVVAPIAVVATPEPQAEPLPARAERVAQVEAEPELALQAIYYRMKGPTVVINGKTLKVGERIDGAKLVIIERNAAIIEFKGTHRRLTIQ